MGDQASVSARPRQSSIFDDDGKLSSASAATAIKYAKPQDLPSFPSKGGVKLSSAGAAANLANNNQKPFEYWKPDPIPAANKAALLAKDYTMQPLWQPGSTKAGYKAARMAHANPIEVAPLQPPTPHYKAQTAAEAIHIRQRAASLSSQQGQTPKDDNAWALKAAAKSHKDGASTPSAASVSGEPPAEAKDDAARQTPTPRFPLSSEAQEKQRQDMLKASAIAMARKMFLIQQQHIDEAAGRTKQANRPDGSIMGASSYYASDNLSAAGGGYENLEEAARRLAQARLAKIHDEHAEYRQYYGAQPLAPTRSRLSARLGKKSSTNAKDRRDDDDDEEQSRKIRSQMSIFQSKLAEVDSKKRQQDRDALLVIAHRNVDAQISRLDEKIFQETGKASPAQMEKWEKAARDKAQQDSDQRMQHTGKVHIGGGKYIDQSEVDAIARARLQPTLDDIAYKADQQRARDEEVRLEKAKKDQEIQAEKTRSAAAAADAKVASAKLKDEEKALKDASKREQKEASVAEKQRRKETLNAEKERERLEKEEQRKLNPERPGRLSSLLNRGSSYGKDKAAAESEADASDDSRSDKEDEGEPLTVHDVVTDPTPGSANAVATTTTENEADPLSTDRPSVERTSSLEKTTSLDEEKEGATSPKNKSRVKSWMRVRFRSKSGTQMPMVVEQDADQLNAAKQEGGSDEAAAKDSSRPESMRDVAMAGRASNESDDLYGPPREVSPAGSKGSQDKGTRDRSASISSLSSHYSEHNKDAKSEEAVIGEAKAVEIKPQTSQEPSESDADGRGRSGFKARLLRKITPQKTATKDDKAEAPGTTNATNENDGNEEFEEARDTFEEEKLSPPQTPSTAAGESKDENGVPKTISPKASRERSRFTEDL